MSGPVPSPSMNGMIGWSGTPSLPLAMVIFPPPAGGVSVDSAMRISASRGNARAAIVARWRGAGGRYPAHCRWNARSAPMPASDAEPARKRGADCSAPRRVCLEERLPDFEFLARHRIAVDGDLDLVLADRPAVGL